MILGPGSQNKQVKVALKRGGLTLAETLADTEGKFSFYQLTEGDYEVLIEVEGYQSHTHQAALRYRVHEEENFTVRLKPSAGGTQGPPGVLPQAPPAARKDFERGLEFARKGNHQQAVEAFRKAVTKAPEFADGWLHLGDEYRALQDWRRAEDALRKALALRPQSAPAHLGLGLVAIAQGRIEEGRKNLAAASEAEPRLAAPHLLLGVLAYHDMEMATAKRELELAQQLDPAGSSEAGLLLGSILAWEGRFAEATAKLNEFLQSGPAEPQAAKARELLARIQRHQSQ